MIKKNCLNCIKEFTVNNYKVNSAKFCSRHCLGVFTGKSRKKHLFPVNCIHCGKTIMVNKYRIGKTKFCSRKCLGYNNTIRLHFGGIKPDWWIDGYGSYRKFKKCSCEKCGSNKFLVVHHLDDNRHNCDVTNLQTLCKRCHQIIHGCVDNLPNK